MEKHGLDGVMSIRKYVGLDDDLFADDALDGEAATVDFGPDRFDDGARGSRAGACGTSLCSRGGSMQA